MSKGNRVMQIQEVNLSKFQEFCESRKIIKAILFGSQARETSGKRSDFDLIIIYDTDKSFFKRYDDFAEIYPLFGNYLDLLLYTPIEWDKIQGRKFFLTIQLEGKILYEQQQSRSAKVA